MMYAAKIEIKREPQTIKYTKRVTLYGRLSMEKLSRHIEEMQTFDILPQDNGMYPDSYIIEIYCERLETDGEVAKRVAKEEKYMENYHIFHSKKATKG